MGEFDAPVHEPDLGGSREFCSGDCVVAPPRGAVPWRTGRACVSVGEGWQGFPGVPDGDYGDWVCGVCGDHAVSKWLLTGTTLDGQQVRVRGCDLFDLAPDGSVTRKDSYWKIVEKSHTPRGVRDADRAKSAGFISARRHAPTIGSNRSLA